MPPTGGRSTHPSLIVLLDGRGLVKNDVALHACPPKSTCGLHDAMLSGQEGILPLIQSSFLHQGLLPQLHDHRRFGHNIGGSPKPNNGENQHRDEGAAPGEQQRQMGTYLNNGNAQLGGGMSVLAHQVDGGLTHGGDSRHEDTCRDDCHQPLWVT
jgi:hypothetical protein